MVDVGVVDDNVGDFVFGVDLFGECFDCFGVGYVEYIGVCDVIMCGDFGGGVFDGGFVDVVDNDFCIFMSKGKCGFVVDFVVCFGN